MTLFIACLLIYQFEMDWKFYVAAVVLWVLHISFWQGSYSYLKDAMNRLVQVVKSRRR